MVLPFAKSRGEGVQFLPQKSNVKNNPTMGREGCSVCDKKLKQAQTPQSLRGNAGQSKKEKRKGKVV